MDGIIGTERFALPYIVERGALRVRHPGQDLRSLVAARELVGVRQQGPFLRHVLDIAGEEFVRLEDRHHLFARLAFRDGDRAIDALAFDERIDDRLDAGMRRELELALVEMLADAEHANADREDEAVVDHPLIQEHVGDLGRAAAPDHHRRVDGERARLMQLRRQEIYAGARDRHHQKEDGEDARCR